MTNSERSTVFDYRALRLLMGIFALTMPIVVSLLASDPLPSISDAYHAENARDAFVGMLCIVAAFLWAYNGHTTVEANFSRVAAIAAALVAFLPTRNGDAPMTPESVGHYLAAATLFAILAIFCLVHFRRQTKQGGGRKGRRDKLYRFCGGVMAACMLGILVANLFLPKDTILALRPTYWGEAIALTAFGVAWIVAGKYIRFFVDEDEALILFR